MAVRRFFYTLWYGVAPPATETEAEPLKKVKIENANPAEQREAAQKSTNQALGMLNKQRLTIETQLYGRKNGPRPIPSLDQQIRTLLKAGQRKEAARLAAKKKRLETRLAQIDGQKENLLRNKDAFDDMETTRVAVDAISVTNKAVRSTLQGITEEEVTSVVDENHNLQEEVSDISYALAFQGDSDIYQLEGEEYLQELEEEFAEEDAAEKERDARRIMEEMQAPPTTSNGSGPGRQVRKEKMEEQGW